jgi:predicted NUDIX family NTP pyrophosphohydrolase
VVVFSAGILLHRRRGDVVEVLLGHPGGPFWARKDDGAWSIPKGEYTDAERPRDAAAREWTEELGLPPPVGPELELGTVRLPSGKRLTAWAVRGDLDPGSIRPGTFELEWPPRSGHRRSFPEIDRVGWFDPDTARVKLARGQAELLDRLLTALDGA